ncbi:class I SAM-dependent methyltransferase [Patescibacteria group bacterium]|nr:class I SAM-dependent methyltransferase [Patescibacteria group bacterium]
MTDMQITRGYGFLENFLAKQREGVANKLILNKYRQGRILDIGCGLFPLFLTNTKFKEKYGLDKIHSRKLEKSDVLLINHDIKQEKKLPFEDNFFDVITMLAVIEHFEKKYATFTLKEIYRILKPGGTYILTTPNKWTHSLLKIMARLKLISQQEIDEHISRYNHNDVKNILTQAGFERKKIQLGYFEFFMNIWGKTIK